MSTRYTTGQLDRPGRSATGLHKSPALLPAGGQHGRRPEEEPVSQQHVQLVLEIIRLGFTAVILVVIASILS
jgi:hypothetical protein